MIVLGVIAAIDALHRGVKIGPLDPAVSAAIPLIGIVGFAIVIYASWRARRRPDAHKRLILIATALAQTPPQNESNVAIRQAVQLAREHRYAEAEANLKGVSAPADPAQKIAFYRLRAAIASGLGHFAAAENMDNAARLAPENQDLRIAAGIARLQEHVQNHISPAQTLKRLRSETLPPQQAEPPMTL